MRFFPLLLVFLSLAVFFSSTVSGSYFGVFYDSGCSVSAQTISTKTGVINPPGQCFHIGTQPNSTFAECYTASGTTTLNLSTYPSATNCQPTSSAATTVTSSGPHGGCNPVTIVSSGSTYNFFLQGSCSKIADGASHLSLDEQFSSLIEKLDRKQK